MDKARFNQDLLDFLQNAPSPFHATARMVDRLEAAGFQPLQEEDDWSLAAGGKYYVTRQDSALIAFTLGQQPGDLSQYGFRMLGTHTDSPTLKVKPQPEVRRHGCFQLGVEVYGGALLNPWFDRDLSLAGRVTWEDDKGTLHNSLVNFRKAVAVIPSLAIHLDRKANNQRSINPQTDILPLLSTPGSDEKTPDFRQLLAEELVRQQGQPAHVLDYDMAFYDTQPPALVGLKDDFIASARLDNLLSCYVGIAALEAAADSPRPCLLVCNDHEEVGSQSASGASGPFLRQVLERLFDSPAKMTQALHKSVLISADNAHGIHPNYADRHDNCHAPVLNAGPVIKINANQHYATSSETSALMRQLCREEKVPVQTFVARTDCGCGSTIGPLTAAELGVRTIDLGLPTFAMHSVRELAGCEDAVALARVLVRFFHKERLLADSGN